MKRQICTTLRMMKKIISLLIVSTILLVSTSTVFAAGIAEGSETTLSTWDQGHLKDFVATQSGENLVFSGIYEEETFCITGKAFCISNNVNSNKIYIVENNPDIFAQVYIINLEFERSAKAENLEVKNQHLIGSDVMRLAAYIDGKIYYIEQEIIIPEIVICNTNIIAESSNSPIFQTIVSNSTWYTHLYGSTLSYCSDTNETHLTRATTSTPILSSDLDSIDRDTIAVIGASKFTGERSTYYWGDSYGYMIQCVEWPAGSGSILASCLYYSIVRNVPSSSNDTASCQLRLVTDRQYRWISETNTIIPHFAGTDFAIYDVKLAVECAWYTANTGYDFIYERSVSSKSSGQNNAAFDISKAFIQCFDKYNLINLTETIFDSFKTTSDTDYTCTWSDDYNTHYTMLDHNKPANTFVRGVRVDTDGRIMRQEGDLVLLQAKIKDRDTTTSSANTSVTKAIKYAVSYNLRSKNAVYGWLFGGNDEGNLKTESYRSYTR